VSRTPKRPAPRTPQPQPAPFSQIWKEFPKRPLPFHVTEYLQQIWKVSDKQLIVMGLHCLVQETIALALGGERGKGWASREEAEYAATVARDIMVKYETWVQPNPDPRGKPWKVGFVEISSLPNPNRSVAPR